VVRDPLELMISSYFYTRAKSRNWKQSSPLYDLGLDDFIAQTDVNMLNHFPRRVTMDNFKDLIDQYFVYIGITEDLDESMRNIASCLGVSAPRKMGRKNQTPRSRQVSAESERLFKEKHQLEYLVYEYARDLHYSFKIPKKSGLIARLLERVNRFGSGGF
jgi:hypothetical protein